MKKVHKYKSTHVQKYSNKQVNRNYQFKDTFMSG